MKFSAFWLIPFLVILQGCQPVIQPKAEIIKASQSDFLEEMSTVSPSADSSISIKLWAPGPLLANAVALSIDNKGNVFVSQTSRRKSSYLDIREHWDWMVQDLALQSAEDKTKFYLETLSSKNSSQNEWLEDFNEDGVQDFQDLKVQKESVRRIWDSNKDGKADNSQIYFEGFNDLLGGVAGGVLAHDGKIYVTANPSLWEVSDNNKDHLGDRAKSIVKGFGVHIGFAGHDLSGATIGLDGKIYWSIGDHGVDVIATNGKRWQYPNEGAIMRCNLDGTDFEVFAHGLRNTHEIAFDQYGNLISVDNDGDHPGENERYVHILEGSDTGWRLNWQYGKYDQPNEKYKVWMDEKLSLPHFSGQAAYVLPPLALAYNGPAGLKFNPGTALSEKWKNHFFASYFTGSSANSKIQAFSLKPKGASFSLEKEIDLIGGIVPTGLAFAPNGSLFMNDWKDSYDKKTEGRIWVMDVKGGKHPLRKETEKLLSEGMKEKSQTYLLKGIAYPDQRVRMAAQFELVRQKKSAALLSFAKNEKNNLLGRLHCIWGLGQLGRKDYYLMKNLLPLLDDKDAQVRAQTAKVLGEGRFKSALNGIKKLLTDKDAFVQMRAIEAIGKIGSPNELTALVQLLETTGDKDPHLRHTIVYAMSRINAENQISNLSSHPSSHVRIGAVVALRMLKSKLIVKFLSDKNDLVLTEVARAINDDLSIQSAILPLATLLNTTTNKQEPFLRRVINANLRSGTNESAVRLSKFVKNTGNPMMLRLDALWALGYWPKPPVLDRVDNYYRPNNQSKHSLKEAHQAFTSIFKSLENPSFSNIKSPILKAAGRLNYIKGEDQIFSIFKEKIENVYVRKEAFYALLTMKSKHLEAAISLALNDETIILRQAALANLEKVSLNPEKQSEMLEKLINGKTAISEKQNALLALGRTKHSSVEKKLAHYLKGIQANSLDKNLHLDVINAIELSSFSGLKNTLNEYVKLNKKGEFLGYEPALFGGNVEKGKEIFIRNEAAQCLRCHAVNGKGGNVGPALEHIADLLTREQLLISLINPNARIANGYGVVILTLKSGEELSGILMSESPTELQLKIGNDKIRKIAKTDIKESELLPSGMLNMTEVLDKNQIRDLVAFLMTLKK